MPEVIDVRPYKIIDDYNRGESIKESINKTRAFLKKKLEEANSISDEIFKRNAMITILDSLAMEFSNYPCGNSREKFVDFVLKFQNRYDFLDDVEPVTLFYDYEDKIKKSVISEKTHKLYSEIFPEELEIDLNDYGAIEYISVPELMKSNFVTKLLDLIEKQGGKDIRDRYERKHKFINLLYKMRSKGVHEFGRLGIEHVDERLDNKEIPYYRDISVGFVENDKLVTYKIYELVIPSKFIYNLVEDCIDNYLDYCLKNKRFPYENNRGIKRKVYISWCD